ncbi:MAG TPA: DNA cytosine methyltransferase [Rhizomicrobium sp.]|jgi:DNA (cytosine-5)-methyltransferase 1
MSATKIHPTKRRCANGAGTHTASVVDLFAGAGGLGIAARLAGGRVVSSIEINPVACSTLRANSTFHGAVIEGDVRSFTGSSLREVSGLKKRDRLVIVGGAPCQPFSKAAYWLEDGKDAAYRRDRVKGLRGRKPPPPTHVRPDERRDLVHEFWRLVRESDADGFVFENVPSIKHPRNLPLYEWFVRTAKRGGFEITEIVANAAEFGVAQTRERVFVLGSRRAKPQSPNATHALPGSISKLRRAVSAGEALSSIRFNVEYEPEVLVAGRWARHLQEVPPGWNYKAHTAWAGHPNPTFVTETRFWNFLLKLAPDRPSWTLAASPGPWTGPFHWSNRRLGTSEMAALQGFPKGYIFDGSRRERVLQVGNAVPVPLGKKMISSVLETLS